MKNLLKMSYLKHLVLGLMLTLVTVSTVWAVTVDTQESNSKQIISSAPRECYYFYYDDPENPDPFIYVWDCATCTKVFGVIPDILHLPQGCNDEPSR